MNLQIKPTLIIIGTLLLGIVLGTLISGTLADQRFRRIRSMMRPHGFAEDLIEAIGPKDEQQRREITAVIENTDLRIQDLMRQSREEIRARIDSMAAELQPLLTDEQRTRLEKLLGDRWPGPMEHRDPFRDRRRPR
ncbi:MAG: hypothetical protein V1784_08950 [bacterium]